MTRATLLRWLARLLVLVGGFIIVVWVPLLVIIRKTSLHGANPASEIAAYAAVGGVVVALGVSLRRRGDRSAE